MKQVTDEALAEVRRTAFDNNKPELLAICDELIEARAAKPAKGSKASAAALKELEAANKELAADNAELNAKLESVQAELQEALEAATMVSVMR